MDEGTRAAEWTRPLSTSTCVWLPVLNRKIQHYTFWVQVSLSEWTKMTELRWLSRFVSSSLTHLFAEFSPTDRGQSLHDASVCLWRATGPNRILYSSVRILDPDGIWFQTSSLKGHGVIWSLLLRISTVVQSRHSTFSSHWAECVLCVLASFTVKVTQNTALVEKQRFIVESRSRVHWSWKQFSCWHRLNTLCEESHPGIRLHRTSSPSELPLMRLSVFVSEMKIPTIPQEKINHQSPEIRQNTERWETARCKICQS